MRRAASPSDADVLMVADSGHGALQRLAFPRLEPQLALRARSHAPLEHRPRCAGRLLVIDGATGRVAAHLRRTATSDAAFAAQWRSRRRPAPAVRSPRRPPASCSCPTRPRTASSCSTRWRASCVALQGPTGWLPGAIAARDARVYVADAATGAILVFDAGSLQGRSTAGAAPSPPWPSATRRALRQAGAGRRLLPLRRRRGARAQRRARRRAVRRRRGPSLGACVDRRRRAARRRRLRGGAEAAADPPHAAPTGRHCRRPIRCLPAPRTARAASRGCACGCAPRSAREAPVVRRFAAPPPRRTTSTTCRTYRRHDIDDFLSRWLKLLRGQFGRIEESIDDLPRLADPDFVPPDSSPGWRSGSRSSCRRSPTTTRRAGSWRRRSRCSRGAARPRRSREFVELHTGIRPAIVEAFAERRVWVLGVTSRLGFDTRLAALEPGRHGRARRGSDAVPCRARRQRHRRRERAAPAHQIGLPLYADEAYRFCVVVDGYRVRDPRLAGRTAPHRRAREARAHRLPRAGGRAGAARRLPGAHRHRCHRRRRAAGAALDATRLGVDTRLPPPDAARVGDARLDGTLILN